MINQVNSSDFNPSLSSSKACRFSGTLPGMGTWHAFCDSLSFWPITDWPYHSFLPRSEALFLTTPLWAEMKAGWCIIVFPVTTTQQPKGGSIFGDSTLVYWGREGVAEQRSSYHGGEKADGGVGDCQHLDVFFSPFSFCSVWVPAHWTVLPTFRVSLSASVNPPYGHTQRWPSLVSHKVLDLTLTMKINHHTRPELPSTPGIPVIPEWWGSCPCLTPLQYSILCFQRNISIDSSTLYHQSGKGSERIGIFYKLF